MSVKLSISGCHGRMGQAIAKLANLQPEKFTISTLLEYENHPMVSQPVFGIPISTNSEDIQRADVHIEFTLPNATIENLESCVKHKVKMIIGTTGFSEDQIRQIHVASKLIPIVFASNMSIGVNILFKLIEIASSKIGANSIKLSETHHIHKKDKPSGTAKTMAEIAEEYSHLTIKNIESLREGEVIGDHTIEFESLEDILTITHHAKDRSMFAKGSLTAAQFLMDKNSGLYNMQDVLGLN